MQRPLKLSKFWLAYFLVTILIEGFVFGTFICVPGYVLGRVWRPARRLAELVMQKGIFLLLKIQPWLHLDLDLSAWMPASHATLAPPTSTDGRGTTDARVFLEARSSSEDRVSRPPSPQLIVVNHRSHLDVFLLLALIPGIRILARRSLFWIPGLNLMMWLSQQIRVGGTGPASLVAALERARRPLRQGTPVAIFPELTRAGNEIATTLPFSLAPFRLACVEKRWVFPLVLTETGKAWPRGKMGLNTEARVRARALAPVDASQFSSAQALCAHVQARIDAELAPTRQFSGARP